MANISKIWSVDINRIGNVFGIVKSSIGKFMDTIVLTGSGGGWEQRFYGLDGFGTGSDEYGDDCTAWDGVKIIEYPNINLGAFMPVSGTWAVGYRPTHVRLTYTGLSEAEGDAVEFVLADTNSNAPVDELNYISGTSVPISWDAYDIDNIQLIRGAMGDSHT